VQLNLFFIGMLFDLCSLIGDSIYVSCVVYCNGFRTFGWWFVTLTFSCLVL